MKEVLIVKNVTREGPGIFGDVLDGRGIAYTTVDLDMGEPFPSADAYGAVVVMGGPDSANDSTAKMRGEVAEVRRILDAEIPYLGICLGFQVLVKAAGGRVVPAPVREIGLDDSNGSPYMIELTCDGRGDPLFDGLVDALRVFHLHGETVDPAHGTILLAHGDRCEHQAVRVGRCAYGIQGHFELTPALLASWLAEDADLEHVDRAALTARFGTIWQTYKRTGMRLFENFLTIVGDA